MNRPQLIVITGPTATGKTALSVEVARRLDGEIVSCDSMQIYRGMDVGTAKATVAERGEISHHLLDVVDPMDGYSVARYQEDARQAIADISKRGKVPILVGGTGLYIDAVLYPMQFREFDPAIREKVAQMYEQLGAEGLYKELERLDPQVASKLHVADVKRVSRAIEIALAGETHSTEDLKASPLFQAHIYVLAGDRQEMYDRIDKRVERMFEDGLLEEVNGLIAQGVDPQCQAFQAIAYKEINQYLVGELSLEETIALIQKRSRNYAKRQLTWMRRYQAVWLDYHNNNVDRVVEDYLHPERYIVNGPFEC